MIEYRAGLPERPRRIAGLPLDERGYPVPWFVAWIDGKPDFRVIDSGKIALAWNNNRCWLCGEPLGRYVAFVIGPMCAVNRISSEPPSHRECAMYAAKACPFLTHPHASRRDSNLPAEACDAAGQGLKRNPGMALVWIAENTGKDGPRAFRVQADAANGMNAGVLFNVGRPHEIFWFTEGRTATRVEIDAAIERGLPALREPAEAQGPEAVAELERLLRDLEGLLSGFQPALDREPTLL